MNPARWPLQAAAGYLQWRARHWDQERLRRHQQRRLTSLISFVRRRSRYYRDCLPTGRVTLSDIPAMTKAEMMEHFDEINTAGLRRDDLVQFRIEQERARSTALYDGRYAVGLSSGTSGNKVLTVLSKRERSLYPILLWARSGIPPHVRERRVLFALRTNNPAFTAITALGVELQYVDYFVPVEELVRLIDEHRLNIVTGPPSLLVQLADQADRIRSSIDAVVSYAEELDDATRRRIEAAFGAPVAEIYQGAEGLLGFTCREGSLHLSEDTALVELSGAGDSVGDTRRVIVTDLYRRTQPFIRYELGDLLEIDTRACRCGSVFRRIARIHGRADSMFVLPGIAGGEVRLMPDYVRRSINQASEAVREYQAIQHSRDDIEIRLELDEGTDPQPVHQAISENLEHWASRAGGRVGRVRFSDTPPRRDPESHKLVRVVRQ